jgi:hypothetical protein
VTLPPERMLDALQFEKINYLAMPGGPAPTGAPGSTAPAPGPAAPVQAPTAAPGR